MENTNRTKKTIKDLKEKIAEMAEYQKVLKNHRKTEHFKGERIKTTVEKFNFETRKYEDAEVELSPSLARTKYIENRYNLRLMYLVYGILRGKKVSQIEDKYTEETHPLYGGYGYNKLLEFYNGEE